MNVLRLLALGLPTRTDRDLNIHEITHTFTIVSKQCSRLPPCLCEWWRERILERASPLVQESVYAVSHRVIHRNEMVMTIVFCDRQLKSSKQ